jgi:hypothetical protein
VEKSDRIGRSVISRTPLDPLLDKTSSTNSRAMTDACRPFERLKDFPRSHAQARNSWRKCGRSSGDFGEAVSDERLTSPRARGYRLERGLHLSPLAGRGSSVAAPHAIAVPHKRGRGRPHIVTTRYSSSTLTGNVSAT